MAKVSIWEFEGETPNESGKRVGHKFLVLEALGFIIGTVVKETPFELCFGSDAVFARSLGDYRDAIRTGQVVEFHPDPFVTIKDHAIRKITPWNHPVPS